MISVGFNACHLVDPEVRGLTRYTVELLRALSQFDGVRLVLFSHAAPYGGHMEGVRAKVVVHPAKRHFHWEALALPTQIRKAGIDVFHAPADRGLPLRKVCHLVVTVHGSHERTHWRSRMPGLKRRARYWLNEAANYFLADAVITVSDTTRDELVSLKVAPERKIIRIFNGVSDRFNSVADPADAATVTSHGVRSPFVLYVGGYDQWKNVDGLIDGFGRSGLGEFQLVIIARKTDAFARNFKAWSQLACFDRIRFLTVGDGALPSFYRRAEFSVHPSRWESFGLQLVEAMACGTPVISSDRKALPEILGEAGLYFDPDDPDALSARMRLLGEDAELRTVLRDRGLRRAEAFRWGSAARRTLAVYEKVAANGGH